MTRTTKVSLTIAALFATVLLVMALSAHAQSGGTINTLDQFTGTTTPDTAITQRTPNKAIKITGLSTGQCLGLNSSNIVISTPCGGSSTGNVATSSVEVSGRVPFYTSSGGTPALISGGSAAFTWDNTLSKLTATNASTTNFTVGTNIFLTNLASAAGNLLATNALGQVIATSSISSASIALPKGNFLVGNDAGVSQATSTVFISSLGQIGIGTTSPAVLLDVYGSQAGTTLTNIAQGIRQAITNASQTNNSYSALSYRTVDANGVSSSTSMVAGVHTSHAASAVSGDLVFHTNNAGSFTEKMRILANGNVGIGTTTPDTIFTIQSGTNASTTLTIANSQSQNWGIGEDVMGINMKSADNSSTLQGVTRTAIRTLTESTTGNLMGMGLFTNPGAAGNIPLERIRITSTGAVGMGTSTPMTRFDIYSTSNNFMALTGNTNQIIDMISDFDGDAVDADSSLRFKDFDTFQAIYGFNDSIDTIQFNTGSSLSDSTAILSMKLDSSNVGIRNVTPTQILTISATSTATSTGSQLELRSARSAISAGSLIGSVLFKSDDTSLLSTGSTTALIQAVAEGNHVSGSLSTAMTFFTTESGEATPMERMRIMNTGLVGIGTSVPTQELHVVGSGIYTSGSASGAALSIGGDTNASTRTVNTNKLAVITMPDYALDGIEVEFFSGASTVSANTIGFGGRVGGSQNAATQLNFITAADVAATGGIVRMLVNAAGQVGIGSTTPWGWASASSTSAFPTLAIQQLGVGPAAVFLGGNVGIGTTSPGTLLGVNGPGVFTGTVLAPQFIATSTTASSTFAFGVESVTGYVSGLFEATRVVIKGIAAAFTPAVEGEIGIDTTSNQFKYYSGGAVRVLAPTITSTYNLGTTTMGTGTTTKSFAGFPTPTTFTQFGCSSRGSGTFLARIGDGTSTSTTVVSSVGLTTSYTTLSSNNAFNAGEVIFLEYGTPTGTVTDPSCGHSRTTDPT